MMGMIFCRGCGKEIHDSAVTCPHCGAPQGKHSGGGQAMQSSEKKRTPLLLLCLFLGGIGIHRFYVGKTGTAIAQIFTLGGLGIWVLIDLIMIIAGTFTDKEGNKITEW